MRDKKTGGKQNFSATAWKKPPSTTSGVGLRKTTTAAPAH